MAEYSSIKQAAQEKKQARKKRIYFDLENPYFFSASGRYLRGLAYPFNGFNLDLGFSYDFFGMGIFVEKGHLAAEKQGVSADESFFLFGATPQIQVPMILGDFLIDVFLQGRFTLCTGDGGTKSNISILTYGLGAGVNLGYYTRDFISPYLTISILPGTAACGGGTQAVHKYRTLWQGFYHYGLWYWWC